MFLVMKAFVVFEPDSEIWWLLTSISLSDSSYDSNPNFFVALITYSKLKKNSDVQVS